MKSSGRVAGVPSKRSLVFLGLALLLAGCDEPVPEKVERIRAIKPYLVSTPADGSVRRYSGTVVAANSSALAFAVSGTVSKVDVNVGDQVKQGQVLAVLEERKFLLDVRSAKAERDARRAELKEAQEDMARKQELFKKGWVAKAAIEKVEATLGVAEEILNLATAQLGLAERDLAKTRLKAPFDGVISERSVEPFAEVKSGEKVFQLDTKDSYEVELSVSDAIVGRLSIGSPVQISTPTVPGCGCEGRITEIGAQAEAANTVTVKATITKSVDGLIPGMAVDAGVTLSDAGGGRGFLVPIVAIAPGDDAAKGYVFKYDTDAGVVRKTPIKSSGGIDGNLIGVSDGVTTGDVVAAAGVSFLRDGQRVTLMGQ